MLSIIQAGSLHHPPGQPQNHSQPFHSGFQAAYLCLRNKNQPWPDLPCIPIISLFALDTTCQVYSHWVIHPQGHFKAHTHSFADNVIYSLQKGKSTAKWPLVYLEVLPFTLSLPVYLQTCTREKKIFTWWCCSVSCYLGVISDSFPHFNPLEPVTKSQRFQWFPLSLTVQVLPVRFLH